MMNRNELRANWEQARKAERANQHLHLAAMLAPQQVGPVAGQVAAALHPFDRYLRSTVKVAAERQVSLVLPWSEPEDEVGLVVEPVDLGRTKR